MEELNGSVIVNIQGEVVQLATPVGGLHGEAELVRSEIMAKCGDGPWSNFAVLYRTNAQSALIERELIKHRVPYTVRGGATFFARKEIYQMVFFLAAAYCNDVRAIVGFKKDEVNGTPGFSGIGNFPTKDFGKTTRYLGEAAWAKLDMIYKSTDEPVDLVKVVDEMERSLDSRARPGARDLGDMLQNLRANTQVPREALEWALENVYELQLKLDTDGDDEAYEGKRSSIAVLMDIASEYHTVKEFVDYCFERMLEGSAKKSDGKKDAVQLMTIHASKGMEFKNVYVIGVIEGFLPHARGVHSEELRLFYVATTRAENYLLLSCPSGTDFYGKPLLASPFVSLLYEQLE